MDPVLDATGSPALPPPLDYANHYWRLEGDEAYSASRRAVVPATDEAFAAWLDAGGVPSRAQDRDGMLTVAAVEDILRACGVIAPAPPSIVSVTRSQAKIQLFRAGLLDVVKVLVEEAGAEVALWFDEAAVWMRDNPNVIALGTEMGLTADQIDDLFEAASQIAE